MRRHYDVIVVGGGVIGCSIAYYLSRHGKQVLIIEKDKLASKASNAAAGILGAQTELKENSLLFRHARKSRDMYPELSQELKELSGIDVELVHNGVIKLAETDEEISALHSIIAFQQGVGEEASWMPRDVLNDVESKVSSHFKGAMYIPNDGNVSAPSLSSAFAHSATILGTSILEHTEVHDFIKEKNKVIGVRTQLDYFYASETIVAGGAWSKQLVDQIGIKLQAFPVKGECFSVHVKKQLIKKTLFYNGCYIVPKSHGRMIIGATEKANTFDETVSIKGISQLMNQAINLIPELENARWEKSWAGIRPQTIDGLPYLDRHPQFAGLSIATGHYRNGILLAPITGLKMAELIDGKSPDPAFRFDRDQVEEVKP